MIFTLLVLSDVGVEVVEIPISCDSAVSILLAKCSISGFAINQLQICNWLVISSNWGGRERISYTAFTLEVKN